MPYLDETAGKPESRIVDEFGKPIDSAPSGQQMDLPYEKTFSSIIQGMSKSFLAGAFDEALRHNRENALAMRRDCWLMALLRERIEGTISRKWSLEIPDETDPVQIAVRDGMTRIIQQIPHFKRILRYLLQSLWYGRAGAQLLWHEIEMDLPKVPTPGLFPLGGNDRESMLQKHLSGGGQLQKGKDGETAEAKPETERRKVTTVRAARPVNGDKLNALFDGTWLIGVYAGSGDDLRRDGADIRDGKDLETVVTWDNEKQVLVLTKEWRERFLIAVHEPTDADFFEAERAGSVMGVGIRSMIYWVNYLRLEALSWTTDFLDRVGLGFVEIKFEQGNVKAEAAAQDIAKKWSRRAVLAVPVSPDQMRSGGGIEVVDVPTAGALVAQEIIQHYERAIERYIIGQTMSSGSPADTGLGGTAGPARMAEQTKHQLLQADAEELEETLSGSMDEPGLLSTIQKYTWPGTIDLFQVRFKFAIDEPDPQAKIDTIVALAGAGMEFSQDSVRKLTGQPAPKDGEKVFGGAPPAPAPGQPGAPPADPDDPDAGEPDAPEPGANGHAGGKPEGFLGLNGKT